MIAGCGLQVGFGQHFASCVGNLAGGRVGILASANSELHSAVNGNHNRYVSITM